MVDRNLLVYFHNKLVGRLDEGANAALSFTYDADYVAQPNAKPLSHSLPIRAGSFDHWRTRPFFAGLLPEGRKFHPHVTLARCKNVPEAPAAEFVATYSGFDLPAINVDAFTLYSSRTGRAGAVYAPEAVYPLER